jgi:hypothetical protein
LAKELIDILDESKGGLEIIFYNIVLKRRA